MQVIYVDRQLCAGCRKVIAQQDLHLLKDRDIARKHAGTQLACQLGTGTTCSILARAHLSAKSSMLKICS